MQVRGLFRERYYKRVATSGVVRMANDRSYFMRRAAQERSAADRAADAAARKAHKELAERYQNLVGAVVDDQPERPAA